MGDWDPQSLLGQPVVIAPMAGGVSTPDLVAVAAERGALGFLAGGYKTAAALATEFDAVRSMTSGAFGVNLFVPGPPASDETAVAAYVAEMGPDCEVLACEPGAPSWDDDGWEEKLETVLRLAPPVVSFTFGCPAADVVAGLRTAGSVVAVTVTTPEEAVTAADRGADVLCVQGSEAGGHRAAFSNDDTGLHGLPVLALIAEVSSVTDLPQVAAGGVWGPEQVGEVLAAGARAAQCGTAFLRCPESGAHPAYKAALVDPRYTETVLTRAFSGRPARGLPNGFVRRHGDAPAAYPEVNNATRPLRAAAADQGDPERMSLWAGPGFRHASDHPARQILDALRP